MKTENHIRNIYKNLSIEDYYQNHDYHNPHFGNIEYLIDEFKNIKTFDNKNVLQPSQPLLLIFRLIFLYYLIVVSIIDYILIINIVVSIHFYYKLKNQNEYFHFPFIR